MENKELLRDCQYGLIKEYLCLTRFGTFYHKVISSVDKRGATDVVYFLKGFSYILPQLPRLQIEDTGLKGGLFDGEPGRMAMPTEP